MGISNGYVKSPEGILPNCRFNKEFMFRFVQERRVAEHDNGNGDTMIKHCKHRILGIPMDSIFSDEPMYHHEILLTHEHLRTIKWHFIISGMCHQLGNRWWFMIINKVRVPTFISTLQSWGYITVPACIDYQQWASKCWGCMSVTPISKTLKQSNHNTGWMIKNH